jgi:hypothetical protein
VYFPKSQRALPLHPAYTNRSVEPSFRRKDGAFAILRQLIKKEKKMSKKDDKVNTNPDTESKTDPVLPHFDTQIDTFDDFLGSLNLSRMDKIVVLSHLFGRNIVQCMILELWDHYIANDFKARNQDEAQYKLLFHNYQNKPDEPLQTLKQIFCLMVTGDPAKDYTTAADKDGIINFLPAGFWHLTEVKKVLVNQTLIVLNTMLGAICQQTYSPPSDWQDEKHDKGLYLSPDEQTKLLADCLIEEYSAFLEVLSSNEDSGSPEEVLPETSSDEDKGPSPDTGTKA